MNLINIYLLKIFKMEESFIKLEGSQIKGYKYNPRTDILKLKFSNESIYSYHPVKREMFNSFLEAESKGSYFYKNIKNNSSIVTVKINNNEE